VSTGAWSELALCAQVDPEIFFPEKGMPSGPARLICGRCDVRPQCLDDALAIADQYGIRGGRSVLQRKVLLRAARAAAEVLS
jgi:WhiB family redox-sensing transcriptional regulator